MTLFYLLLVTAGAFPLVAFFIKRTRYRKILREGIPATAKVTNVQTRRRHKGGTYDSVTFMYLPEGSGQYQSGAYPYRVGKYKTGDSIPLYYLPDRPSKYALVGTTRYEPWVILALVVFFAFTVYACFKIEELTAGQQIYFNP